MKITTSSAGFAAVVSLLLVACGGGGGGGSSNPPPPPPPDTTAPVTALATTSAVQTAQTTITFTFSANENSSFETRLDGAAFAAATSPQAISGLGDGSHTFEVRARDAAGNVDATPASFTWTVDSTPPDTTITSAPSSSAVVNVSTFTVTSTETGGTIEASVDGAAFAAVTIPYTAGSLADGPHSIQFRARDAMGNVDATPATANWTLDATPPQARLIFPSRNFYTDAATVSVRGTAQDPRGVTAVSINGIAAQTTDGFAHWNAVIPVPVAVTWTTMNVSSTDGLGNTGAVVSATMINRGPFLHTVRSVAFDAARDRVLINDWGTGNIVAIRRSDGIGTLLSPGAAQGTTPGSSYQEMVVDAANNRLLALDAGTDELIAINLTTGVRSVLSPSGGGGSPTRTQTATGLALDAANQYAYTTVSDTRSLVRFNLANGVRSVVSSDTIGTGDPLGSLYGLAVDNVTAPNAPRVLAVSSLGIVAIDLTTGNRTPFSSASVGTGPPITFPLSMVLDPVGQRVIVNDSSDGGLVAVALATGNRSPLPGAGVPVYFAGIGLAFDSVNRLVFGPQDGAFAEVNTVTLTRRLVGQQNIGLGERINPPAALFIEQPSGTPNSLIYINDFSGTLYRVDLATSNRSIISGTGPSLMGAVDMVLDRRPAANGRAALVLVSGSTPALISVDLVTGTRTLVTNIVTNALNNAPQKMTLDVANNRVLFGNDELGASDVDQLYAINLATGNITAVSDASKTGPTFARPGFMVLEPAANPTRVIVADPFATQFLAINLATGNRSTFNTSLGGSGVTYQQTGPMILDTAQARLLVNHVYYPSNIFTIPLSGGTREIVTGANPAGLAVRGTGPPLFWVTAMDADFSAQVAYEASTNNASIIAVDLVSGDRVVLAH